MRELLSWNVSLGRWAGLQVRLHVFFVLLAALVLFGPRHDMLAYALAALGILFLSVLLHELAHCWAAWRVGGHADQILLGPFGGLSHVNVSNDPHQELATSLVGPLLNLVICLVVLPPLVAVSGSWEQVLPLLNPLEPPAPPPGDESITWLHGLAITFWLNWWLAMVNLLPAVPLDGGRALRALVWPHKGYRTAVLYVVLSAKLTAMLLVLVAWLVRNTYSYASLPLVVFGIFLYFTAKTEALRLQDREPDDAPFGYDFSQGFTSLEGPARGESEPGLMRRWIEKRREERERRRQQVEADEERRMDDILERLQRLGRQSLSDEDRALLDRVSTRYRNRQRG